MDDSPKNLLLVNIVLDGQENRLGQVDSLRVHDRLFCIADSLDHDDYGRNQAS